MMKLLFRKRGIAKVVKRLAREIEEDYRGQDLILIGIQKGSFIFLADLVRQIRLTPEIDFIEVSSYSGVSQGKVTIRECVLSVKGKHVLIVEDIVDTGRTALGVVQYFREKGAASVKLCTLLDKPSRRKVDVVIDYLGFTVPDRFVVGYGLDYNEKYRNLPEIFALGE